jgi:hypothetical protein
VVSTGPARSASGPAASARPAVIVLPDSRPTEALAG